MRELVGLGVAILAMARFALFYWALSMLEWPELWRFGIAIADLVGFSVGAILWELHEIKSCGRRVERAIEAEKGG